MNILLKGLLKAVGVEIILSQVWAKAYPKLRERVQKTPGEVDDVALQVVNDVICKLVGVCVADE